MIDGRLLSSATRAKTLPVMLSPVAVGGALGWKDGQFFTWGWFLVTLLGAAALHLGANVLNDYFDERSGADKMARLDRSSIVTGSGMISSGTMMASEVLGLAAALFIVALACGVALALARGWLVVLFGAAGAFLAWQYVAPPLRYGYRGRGLGEVGIFAAFGFLPVVGTFYVQTQRVTSDVMWASLAPGMLTTLVLYHHHFLHWKADRAAGKMTPVAVLGPETGLIFSGIAITATYVVLVAQVATGLFPAWSLFALATAFPMAGAWSRAFRDPTAPQRYLNLLGSTLGASVLTGLVLTVSLAATR